MYKDKKILAIIPARGGSKGLPGKNIKPMNGQPLIAWTIQAAQVSRLIDDIYVSTDSQEIADVCVAYGVNVPELRPDYLAEDTTSSMDVIEYTLNELEKQGKKYDYIMLLEPTSPLRKDKDIDEIIKLACDNPDKDGVISVGEVHMEKPAILKKFDDEGNIVPFFGNANKIYQRQQADKSYFPYGVAYLTKVDSFRECHSLYAKRMLPYLIERWQNYEIDDMYDFICIEAIMKMKGEKDG